MHDKQLPCVDEVKLKGDQIKFLYIYSKYIPILLLGMNSGVELECLQQF